MSFVADQKFDAAAGDRLARRNSLVLAFAQALAGANNIVIVGTVGILGGTFGDKAYATVPVSAFVVGMWVGTLPVGVIAKRYGRRTAFLAGATYGGIAGLILAAATYYASFVGLCIGSLFGGFYAATHQSYRFAAADTASEVFRPKAISWVLAGGVLAGVFGSQLTIATQNLLSPYLFAASYLAQAAVAILAAAVLWLVKIPLPASDGAVGEGRPLSEIFRQPRLIVAVFCGVVSYSMMNLIMTSAPVAMVDCNHSITDATLGLQWHVIAMFGPSFFTGSLIAKFGTLRVIGSGFVIMGMSVAVALSGLTIWHFWVALALLGAGWNFAFIAATALVTQCHRPTELNKVQAVNDFLVFGSMAVGSFASGQLLANYGWDVVNQVALPGIFVAFLLLLLVGMGPKANPAGAASIEHPKA
jgi:predicted MFS family arabinose efflux permease